MLAFMQNVSCNDREYINLVCSRYQNDNTLAVSILTVESSWTIVGKVLHPNGTKYDTSDVEWLSIATGMQSVKFVPAGIKKKFPKLTKFEIIKSGLTHLEREDMRQFGDDLSEVNFWQNSLKVLESDVFEFNPYLVYIGLHDNPLKFISAELFYNFKHLTEIENIEIQNSHCINQQSFIARTDTWSYSECNDDEARNENKKVIADREDFFRAIFPEIEIARQALEIIEMRNELKDFRQIINKTQELCRHIQ